MTINDPTDAQEGTGIIGPVPILPDPGEVYICGPEVTAHIAVTGLIYCTAIFLRDPVSGARAMIHFNFVSGPGQTAFDWAVRHLREKYNAQVARLAVSLFNNTTSSSGKPFPESMYRIPTVKTLLERALGPAGANITATRYRFAGTIALMDAQGNVRGARGPALVDSRRALRMNWKCVRANTTREQRPLIGTHTGT